MTSYPWPAYSPKGEFTEDEIHVHPKLNEMAIDITTQHNLYTGSGTVTRKMLDDESRIVHRITFTNIIPRSQMKELSERMKIFLYAFKNNVEIDLPNIIIEEMIYASTKKGGYKVFPDKPEDTKIERLDTSNCHKSASHLPSVLPSEPTLLGTQSAPLGPNPPFGGLKSTVSLFGRSSYAWIEGEGMVHALNFQRIKKEIRMCRTKIDTLRGRPFTSRSKTAPGTDELVIMGVDAVKPFYVLGIISVDGEKLVYEVDLKFKRSRLSHDIGITQKYNVILDVALIVDINRLLKGDPLMKLKKGGYARIGVMPRYGDTDSVKRFDVEYHSTFYILNCFEDENKVVLRGFKALQSIIPSPNFGSNKFGWFSRGLKPIIPSEADQNTSTEDESLCSLSQMEIKH
ncbi:hypothetical protein GIB67_018783 [Kingdonia uniflora]|uniref:Uncharacterized protein n=1 Tax=Kingdonia uniflora TaxID=39325 RepID=A0A7J7NDN2_9MAGN|nr:hypothetical protein GIB67_018783 [Kingdonia uniflora]